MHTRIDRNGIKLNFVALWLEEPVHAAHLNAAERAGITLSEHVRRLLHKPGAVGAPVEIGEIKIPVPTLTIQRTLAKVFALAEKQKSLLNTLMADPLHGLERGRKGKPDQKLQSPRR